MLKRFISKIAFPILYVINIIRNFVHPLKFYSEDDTIELVKNGYSISRMGDGELDICIGRKGIDEFQQFNKELQKKLNDCLGKNMSAGDKYSSVWIFYLGGIYFAERR